MVDVDRKLKNLRLYMVALCLSLLCARLWYYKNDKSTYAEAVTITITITVSISQNSLQKPGTHNLCFNTMYTSFDLCYSSMWCCFVSRRSTAHSKM